MLPPPSLSPGYLRQLLPAQTPTSLLLPVDTSGESRLCQRCRKQLICCAEKVKMFVEMLQQKAQRVTCDLVTNAFLCSRTLEKEDASLALYHLSSLD